MTETNTTQASYTTTPTPQPTFSPLLIFVLGPPCAGKSTICTLLAERYDLDHFSLGEELRSLVSSNPTGHAARIKSKLSVEELKEFASNVRAGTLGPPNQMPKYIKERIFPESVKPEHVRILVDGFPRGVERWETFKEVVKDRRQPGARTWAIVMNVDRNVAYQRFVGRVRAGDVFDERFDSHLETIGPILEAMRRDGVQVVEYTSVPEYPLKIFEALDCLPRWVEDVTSKEASPVRER